MPLLSLVIPTRNRQEFAISLLEGIRASDTQELEVVVQDNSDDASLEDFVSGLGDPRIRYFHFGGRLSMHQNFDLAVDKAQGDYVCAIGDDDGLIVPAALDSVRRAKSVGADALLTETYSYSWPGTCHRTWGDIGGFLYSVRAFPGVGGELLDPEAQLEELFRRGSVGGLGLLPRVYHGYVGRVALKALKERCGTYFPGGSPDLANAVALVPFIKMMLFDPSVTLIAGHSPGSGGGKGAEGQHHSELEQATHLPSATVRNWDPAIPRFWSGTTIYAQTAVEAAKAVSFSSASSFNYTKVCVASFIYQPKAYRKHIRAALNATGRRWESLGPLLAAEYATMTLRRSRALVKNIGFYYLGIARLGRFDSIRDVMLRFSGCAKTM